MSFEQQAEEQIPVLVSKEIDVEKIVFIDVPPKDGKPRNVRIRYQHEPDVDPERFLIQTAKMRMPFGIGNNKKFTKDDGDKLKWDIQLSFQGEDRSKRIKRFRTAIEEIDNRIKEEILKNGDVWLPLPDEEDDDGKFISQTHNTKTVRKCYKSALKRFKPKPNKPEEIYPDNFKISIPWKYASKEDNEGAPSEHIQFYDEAGRNIDWKSVQGGCEAIAVFEINGLFCSTGFGTISPSVKLVQLQIFRPKKLKGFQIKYEAEDDEEEEEGDSIEGEEEVEVSDEGEYEDE